jgi:uncharacterized membrane protein
VKRIVLTVAALVFAAGASAQHQHQQQPQEQPYAGQQQRELKTLSPEEVSQYLTGAGMGYAKAAELNRYPGPMHALELADPLGLSPEQREAIRRLMDAHKAQARAIGAKLVNAERNLDQLFRSGGVQKEQLEKAVQRAADLQGEYRLSHLETHRRMRPLLNEEQLARYESLRGYSSTSTQKHSKH